MLTHLFQPLFQLIYVFETYNCHQHEIPLQSVYQMMCMFSRSSQKSLLNENGQNDCTFLSYARSPLRITVTLVVSYP